MAVSQLELLQRAAGLLLLRGKPFGEVGRGESIGFPGLPVSSSNVEVVGPYDPLEKKLQIEFKGGRIYEYEGIEAEEYYNLLKSPSKGQYVNAFIAYSYPYERLS